LTAIRLCLDRLAVQKTGWHMMRAHVERRMNRNRILFSPEKFACLGPIVSAWRE
jgi:hypothetical protein